MFMVNIFIWSPARFAICLGLLCYLTHVHGYLYDIGSLGIMLKCWYLVLKTPVKARMYLVIYIHTVIVHV